MLDVPTELVRYLARLLSANRRLLGTRRRTRALTCYYQALMILIWFRKAKDAALLGAGFGISRATAYRYLAEGITVPAAQRPDLHDALQRATADGWAFVILDGKLFDSDRAAETTTSVKGKTIDARYSGNTATGPPPNSTYPPSPTPATKEQDTASKPRPGNPRTGDHSRPPTDCYAACAGKANEASPS